MERDSFTNYIKSFKHFLIDKQYDELKDNFITLNEAKDILNKYIKDWHFYLSKKNYLHQLRFKFLKIFLSYEEDKNNIILILSLIEDWVNCIDSNEINNFEEYTTLKNEITKLTDNESKDEEEIKKLINEFIFTEKYESLQNEFDLLNL
jgi:hypothetical protein